MYKRAVLSVILCTFAAFQFLSTSSYAQTSPCDDRLKPAEGSWGYAEREPGVRCEGFHVPKVASSGDLEVVSLLKGELPEDWHPNTVLRITKPNIDSVFAESVRVRGMAIPLDTYYRMDAFFDSRESILWPVGDVLFGELDPYDVGVYGWIGNESARIYVPIRVDTSETSEKLYDDQITLTIRTSVDLESFYVSFEEVQPPNQKSKVIFDRTLYVEEAIDITIPEGRAMLLNITVKGQKENSDEWAQEKVQLLRPTHEW